MLPVSHKSDKHLKGCLKSLRIPKKVRFDLPGLSNPPAAAWHYPAMMDIAPPKTKLPDIAAEEQSLALPRFNADDAFRIGSALRKTLQSATRPALVSISTPTASPSGVPHILFQCVTGPGTFADNTSWALRKRAAVLRFGHSTWYMRHKVEPPGDERAFAAKYGLGEAGAAEYAIHGGGWPVFVRGVEGVVAVIVVSGLAQEEDHGVIVHVLREWHKSLNSSSTGST